MFYSHPAKVWLPFIEPGATGQNFTGWSSLRPQPWVRRLPTCSIARSSWAMSGRLPWNWPWSSACWQPGCYYTGSIQTDKLSTRTNEIVYWLAILVSNTLGTALGDFTATSLGLGFGRGALVFGGLIALAAVLYLTTRISRSLLFWAAYVLTRPLGATLGDTLTKPHVPGGLDFGRIASSGILLLAIGGMVAMTSLRRGQPSKAW